MDMFGKKIGTDERASLEIAEISRQSEWKRSSFLRNLYEGRFLWDLVHPFPEQTPEDKQKGDVFLASLEKLLREKLDPDKVDTTGEIPKEVLQGLFELGAFAMKIPETYGGLGLSKANYGRALHLISSYCGSTAVLLSAHQSIGVPQPLLDFGTETQKQKYLPKFRKDAISGFALTEPDAGSDPSRLTTTATPIENGDHYLINGKKLWCTNGVIADVLIVMAVTPPKMIQGKEKKQITAFIVETKTPGFKVTNRCEFMGIHGAKIGLITFSDVKVPRENMLGGEGEGLKLALTTLNTGRLSIPAGVTGISKYALHASRLWAAKRKQWGAAIGEHEAIADKLANMAASVLAMDSMTWYVTHSAMRSNSDIRLEAAVAKKFCAESSWLVVNEALQIRGGRGYESSQSLKERGESEDAYPLERMVRDCRINSIIEGTHEIMNLFITREALDGHLKRMMPLFNPRASLWAKIKALFTMTVAYTFWYPSLWLPVFGFGNRKGVPKKLEAHLIFVRRTAKRLARKIFHSMMIYQQTLAKKECLAARFVDIGNDLFAITTVCSYVASKIKNGEPEETTTPLADLFCNMARARIDGKFHELRHNQDATKKALSKKILNGQYDWLERDIIK